MIGRTHHRSDPSSVEPIIGGTHHRWDPSSVGPIIGGTHHRCALSVGPTVGITAFVGARGAPRCDFFVALGAVVARNGRRRTRLFFEAAPEALRRRISFVIWRMAIMLQRRGSKRLARLGIRVERPVPDVVDRDDPRDSRPASRAASCARCSGLRTCTHEYDAGHHSATVHRSGASADWSAQLSL
jgi:hypothetical protein